MAHINRLSIVFIFVLNLSWKNGIEDLCASSQTRNTRLRLCVSLISLLFECILYGSIEYIAYIRPNRMFFRLCCCSIITHVFRWLMICPTGMRSCQWTLMKIKIDILVSQCVIERWILICIDILCCRWTTPWINTFSSCFYRILMKHWDDWHIFKSLINYFLCLMWLPSFSMGLRIDAVEWCESLDGAMCEFNEIIVIWQWHV
jgi:hypothetical protein